MLIQLLESVKLFTSKQAVISFNVFYLVILASMEVLFAHACFNHVARVLQRGVFQRFLLLGNLFHFLCAFSELQLMWTVEVPALMPGQQVLTICIIFHKNIVCYLSWLILNFFSALFTHCCEIMCSPQYSFSLQNYCSQSKTQGTHWYCLIQSVAVYHNLTSVLSNHLPSVQKLF